MEEDTRKSGLNTSVKANHLCVLVHGLWGNPSHLIHITDGLRELYGEDKLRVLVCKRNAGSFTYDGIEVGAERCAKEIEDTLDELAREGYKITKLSIAGYSMGGLVARYAIGLLNHKGWFEKIRPVNFTTFATPHLGVRTPLIGFRNQLWNVLGARTLSTSGQQLFTIDKFRDTGRPLLGAMADPDSIFIRALAKFERRSLYTNIVNDRSAVYYTTAISRFDPYNQLNKLDLHYLQSYEPNVLDLDEPYTLRKDQELPSFYSRLAGDSQTFVKRAPLFLALAVVIPIATVAFLINAAVQTIRSHRRIQLHETDFERHGFSGYRIPIMVNDMRQAVEGAFENANAAQGQEYLPEGSEEMAEAGNELQHTQSDSISDSLADSEKSEMAPLIKSTSHADRHPDFPTLALTTEQFGMIKALDDVGFRKYPVHIHKTSHSHAAMVARNTRASLQEGTVVIRHWLKEEFKI